MRNFVKIITCLSQNNYLASQNNYLVSENRIITSHYFEEVNYYFKVLIIFRCRSYLTKCLIMMDLVHLAEKWPHKGMLMLNLQIPLDNNMLDTFFLPFKEYTSVLMVCSNHVPLALMKPSLQIAAEDVYIMSGSQGGYTSLIRLTDWHYIIKYLGQILSIYSGSPKQVEAMPGICKGRIIFSD